METTSIDSVMESIRAGLPPDSTLEVPPKCFVAMQARCTAYEPGKSLTVEMPVLDHYAGPTGVMQGGFTTAAFDNCYGPFSYLLAKGPCVTKTMDCMYLRPVMTGKDEVLTVTAVVVARTRNVLFLEARAFNRRGKLVATSTTTMMPFRGGHGGA